MSAKTIKPGKENSNIVGMLMLSLVCFILVACDRSKTDERVERAVESEQLVPDKQAEKDGRRQTDETVLTRQTNIVVAPGNIVVLALSTYNARAVVKSAQGIMQTMKPGDVVPGTETTLIDILDDRLVFEKLVTKPSGLKTRETIWVYKAKDGVSRVQVLNQQSPELKNYTVKKIIIASD